MGRGGPPRLALQAEPTAAEVDDQQLPVIESVIRVKDYVWGGIILLLCIGVACFLNIYNLVPYVYSLLEANNECRVMVFIQWRCLVILWKWLEATSPLLLVLQRTLSMMFSVGSSNRILQTPRGLYEVKLALERSPDGLFSYQLMEETEDGVRMLQLFYTDLSRSQCHRLLCGFYFCRFGG